MRYNFALAAMAFAAALPISAGAQTLTSLTNQPPDGAVITMQMTDGTVIAQGENDNDWWKLTPDNKGSYVNGTWTQLATLPSGYSPYAMAEAVLADGRLLISGGEYNETFNCCQFTNQSAIYDPLKDTWTMVAPPKGWTNIGDAPSIVLPDGRFVIGFKFTTKMAALDPKTLKWTELKSKGKNGKMIAEEGWVLQPDGTFLTVDVKAHPDSELYDPKSGKWLEEGDTANVDLRGAQNCCGTCIPYGKDNKKCYDPPGETGAGVRRPDGTVFFDGSMPDGEDVAHTAIWTPPSKGKKGTWAAGPNFPNGDQAYDNPVSILPNGNVLAEGASGQLYEFDGKNLNTTKFAGYGELMPLPSGEVLVGGYAAYKTTGTYDPSWAPTVSSSPSSVTRGQTYQISGTQFNGLNQGSAFGDEFDSHTNYPLVRITNNSSGHVFYCRTHDHSTMGVATGSKTVSTNFDVPSGMETGASQLVVVANGIPSTAVAVTVQ
ncbi:MAG TPA: hypothetical protein VHU23_13180 [Rhizomicrobium sp.]|jgi:hypothetical protein|nr:hypothetical protein [Rhizomicrobium sp.]